LHLHPARFAKIASEKKPDVSRERSDATVATGQREIERVFGLPEGSVRLHLPSGRPARADKASMLCSTVTPAGSGRANEDANRKRLIVQFAGGDIES
jgi:hypothetical protein